jgi:hypothetical protein
VGSITLLGKLQLTFQVLLEYSVQPEIFSKRAEDPKNDVLAKFKNAQYLNMNGIALNMSFGKKKQN